MNLVKQLPHVISGKAVKMSTYRKLAITLLTVVLWLTTTATSFAYTNTAALGTFNSIALQRPVKNIAPRQLFLQEPTNLLADTSSFSDESQIFQQDSFVEIFQEFKEAWKQPNIKESLFKVCQSNEVDKIICLDLLKTEIKAKKQKLIDFCYKTSGSNGRLCLDLTLKQLGLKLSDLDRWINELQEVTS